MVQERLRGPAGRRPDLARGTAAAPGEPWSPRGGALVSRARGRRRRGDRPPLHLHPPRLPRCRGPGAGVHRRGRHLPGQPLAAASQAPLAEPPFELYRRLRRRNPAAFAAYPRLRRSGRCSAPRRSGSCASTRTAGTSRPGRSRAPARAGSDPMHDAALGRALSRERQGPRRERDDRRPAAQRPVAGLPAGHGAGAGAVRAGAASDGAPPGLDGGRASSSRRPTPIDLLRAAFPGGSITGAPKVRAMEIIAELEPSRRGRLLRLDRLLSASRARWTRASSIRTYLALRGRVYFQVGRRHRRRLRPGAGVPGDPGQGPGADRGAGATMILLHRQLRLVRLQPGPLRPRARRDAGRAPERRDDGRRRSPALAPVPHHHLARAPARRPRPGSRPTWSAGSAPRIPILGVCLGHQCIGAAYGGEIVRAGRPMHGKTSLIHHRGDGPVPRPAHPVPRHPLPLAGDRPGLGAGRAGGDGHARRTARSWPSSIAAIRCTACSSTRSRCSPSTATAWSITSSTACPPCPARLPLAADGALVPAGPEPGTLASTPPPVDLVR